MSELNTYWIAGTPRVGSMWTFNVVKRVLELKGFNVLPKKAYNKDEPSRLFEDRALHDTNSRNKYVFKSHSLLPANIPRSKIITNIRNPFYICASFFEFMKVGVEHSLSVAMKHEDTINHYRKFDENKVLFLKYENIEDIPVRVIKEISKFLGFELTQTEAKTISDDLSKEKIKKLISKNDTRISNLKKRKKKMPSDEIVEIGNDQYRSFDRNTGFQTGHISNRKSDDWKSPFSALEVELITNKISSSVKRLGYETKNTTAEKDSEQFEIKLSNGKTSFVDKNIKDLIVGLRNASHKSKLPNFLEFDSILKYDRELREFYSFILINGDISVSQLFQDLFVLFVLDQKKEGTFLEIGATNGIELSNSYLLEMRFNWKGVLAEPSTQWHKALWQNRPKSTKIKQCLYSSSGEILDFFVSNCGVLSTIDKFRFSDEDTMPSNSAARNKAGKNIQVETISLNDVFEKYFGGLPIDYISLDTEGSEFEILKDFNFKKYGPKIITVEHNFSKLKGQIDKLLKANGYSKKFEEFTQFDAWYVRQT